MQGFAKQETEDIDIAITQGVEAVKAVLQLGMDKALSGMRVQRI